MQAIGSKQPIGDINIKHMWHLRLGHIRKEMINILEKDGLLGLLTSGSYPVRESYLQEKMIKLSFIGQGERITEILVLVHIDMCGPFDVAVREDYHNFITFTDDYLWYEYVYLMRHKSKAFERFKEFRNKREKQIEKSLKIF